jgi:hypothetical protein
VSLSLSLTHSLSLSLSHSLSTDIDFGHFLGNYKEKFGFKRERAPFVFTPQYAAVLGGQKSELYQSFVEVACNAHNILRKHSTMFINLFQMVCSVWWLAIYLVWIIIIVVVVVIIILTL